MKMLLRVSLWLNLILLGVLFYLAVGRKQAAVPAPSAPEVSAQPVADRLAPPAPPMAVSEPFCWRQLVSTKSYRAYIRNLRAIGCPEATIQDIVRGDTQRAFAFERRQLGLDGSGAGPWSEMQERQLIASLLETPAGVSEGNGRAGIGGAGGTAQASAETQPAANGDAAQNPAQTAAAAPARYPLFLQNPDWNALGFDAGQQAVIAQVRQQYQAAVRGLTPSSADPANPDASAANSPGRKPLSQSPQQTALQAADEQLRGLLGVQGYLAYEQQQYYSWFQPQVMANAGGGSLNIDPGAFSMQ